MIISLRMQLAPSQPARTRSRLMPAIVITSCAGVLCGVAVLAVFLHEAKARHLGSVALAVSGRTLRIDTSQPTVVEQVRRLSRLESVSYTMDKMVAGDRENRILPAFLTGDKILLEVHGEAIAGVDLGQLGGNDVVLNGKDGAHPFAAGADFHGGARRSEDACVLADDGDSGAGGSESRGRGARAGGRRICGSRRCRRGFWGRRSRTRAPR